MRRKRRLAIVANEFFAPELGRMGGFGWAAREASRAIADHLDAELDVLFISCEHREGEGWPTTVHGRSFVAVPGGPPDWRRVVSSRGIDALLTIDFRPSYAPLLRALPRTPVIVWVRDPRPAADVARLGTLRIPGSPERPQGLSAVDCTGLAEVAFPRRRLSRRRVVFASPAPETLTPRAATTYGIEIRSLEPLPNPMEVSEPSLSSSGRHPSRIVFLGRLDPIKRPWVAVELARRMPEIELQLLGQGHFEGPGSWQPNGLPANIRLHGHLRDAERNEALGRAAVMLNTSIWEGLPISFLDALVHELPIVAGVDAEDVVSRFGTRVEMASGDGLETLPAFQRAVAGLLADRERRRRLGREGRAWVTATHTSERFAERLVELLSRLGVRLASSSTS